uniref:Uncharacterized protein n=1 Tax=Anguilla anguilla TaxID=7936 RepID=A0A0E9U4S6_ANGAN
MNIAELLLQHYQTTVRSVVHQTTTWWKVVEVSMD